MTFKKLFLSLILILLCALGVCLFVYKQNMDSDAKKYYIQGSALFQDKKYSDAYYNYSKIRRFSNLYTSSLIKQYMCANNLADKQTAQIKLKELLKKTKDQNLSPWVMYNEALLSFELGMSSDKKTLEKFKTIAKNYPYSDYGVAANYQIAVLIKDKDKLSAKEKFLEYLKYAPLGKYSKTSSETLIELNIPLNQEEYELIADSYFQNQKYKPALKNYLKSDFSSCWDKISKCYRALGDYTNEQNTILRGLQLNTSDVEEDTIYNMLDRYFSLSLVNKTMFLENSRKKYSYITPTAAYKLAQITNSKKTYEEIVQKYPNSHWASNSLWEVFWYNYKQKKYKTAISLAKIHYENYKDFQDAPRVRYWCARALLKENKKQEAYTVLKSILKDYPLSYYAYLSDKRLNLQKDKFKKTQIPKQNQNSLNKYIFQDDTLYELAINNDFDVIEDLKTDNEYIKSRIYYKKSLYPLSITTAQNKYLEDKNLDMSLRDWQLKLIYPILYENTINKYSKEKNLSPYLILSLIREESHFDKNSKSSADAMGLTQILPSTAEFILKKPISKKSLLDEDLNIKAGVYYFSYLVDYFKGNVYLAILAYNAGPGKVDSWRSNKNIDDIEFFIEEIPYLETKTYIKKILSSYFVYSNIY